MKTVEEMKEFKGTKGEWRVYEYDDTVVVSDIEHNGMVTEVHTPDKHCNHLAYCHDGTHWGEDIEVAKANAQLIAAAPELLDALIETDKDLCVLEGNMAQIEKSDPRADGMTTLVSEWRKRNKKAINKALGL